MLNRGCEMDADTNSSIRETFAIGSAGSIRASTRLTAEVTRAGSFADCTTICISEIASW